MGINLAARHLPALIVFDETYQIHYVSPSAEHYLPPSHSAFHSLADLRRLLPTSIVKVVQHLLPHLPPNAPLSHQMLEEKTGEYLTIQLEREPSPYPPSNFPLFTLTLSPSTSTPPLPQTFPGLSPTPNQKVLKENMYRILHQFTTSIVFEQNEEELLWKVAQNCISLLGFEDCVIYLMDSSGTKLIQKAVYGPKEAGYRSIFNPIEIPIGTGITGTVAQTLQAELIHDVTRDPRYIVDDEPRKSELCVPILHEDKLLGVIDSEHSLAGFFNAAHLEIMEAIANVIGPKLEEIQSRKHLSQQEKNLRQLMDGSYEWLIWSVNPQFLYKAFNPQHQHWMESVWGSSPQVGKSFLAQIPDERVRTQLTDYLKRALKGEESRQLLSLHIETHPRFFEFSFTPILNWQQEIEGVSIFARDITAVHQGTELLKASESMYRQIFENSYQGLVLLDTEPFQVIECNPKMLALLREPDKENFLRTPPENYLVSLDGTISPIQYLNQLQEATQRNEKVQAIIKGKRADGELFDAEITAVSHYLEGKRYILCFINDITAQILAEEAAKTRQDTLDNLMRYLPVIFYRFDKTGVFLESVGSGLKALSLEENQVVGMNLFDLYGNAPIVIETHKEALKTGFGSGVSAVQVGDQIRYYDNTVFYDEHKHGGIGIAFDITEQQTAELALKDREALLSSINRNTRDAIIRSTLDGGLQYVNEAFFRLFGQVSDIASPGTFEKLFVEKSLADVFSPPRQPSPLDYLETWCIRADGSRFLGRLRVMMTPQPDGNHVIDAFISDVTRQRRRDHAFQLIAENIALGFNDHFFKTMTQSMAEALQVPFVLIGQLQGNTVQTQSFWAKGQHLSVEFDLLHTPSATLIHKQDFLVYKQGIQQAFPLDKNLLNRRIEGYLGMPLIDSTGTPIGIMAIMDTEPLEAVELAQNIMKIYASRIASELERSANVQALKQSEIRFRKLFEQSPMAIAIRDVKTRTYIQANDNFYTLMGYDPHMQEKLTWEMINCEETTPESEELTRQLIHGEISSIRKHKRYRHKLGHIILCDTTRYLMQMDNQDYIIGIVEDITDQYQAELDLLASEEKFRSMTANIPGVVFRVAINPGFQPLFISPQIEQLLGYKVQEFMENDPNIWEIFHPDDEQFLRETTFQAMLEDQSYDLEGRIIRADEEVRWVNIRGTVIKDEEGNSMYTDGVIIDITLQKAAEGMLKDTQAVLASKLEELDEKNRELQQYIESNLQLENFAYMASHDLREPLLTTISFAKLIQTRYSEKLDEQGQQFISYIINATQNMSVLIQELLAFSLVQSEHENEEVNLPELLSFIVKSLESTIQETQTLIEWDTLPTTLMGSRSKLQQLFQNLISNAIKFQKPGLPPHIQIISQDSRTHWRFQIKDNGIGIEPQYFEKIFLLFRRLNNKNEYPGTGIGLSTCKTIVEQHGGKIWLKSDPGKGTSFYFTIAKG